MRYPHAVTVTLASVCLLAPRASLAAQDSTQCWFDTLGHTFRDTVTIGLAPLRVPKQSEATTNNYLLIAQTIQENFQRPAAVHLPLWARTVGMKQSNYVRFPSLSDSLQMSMPAPYGLHGYILFRLDETGHLADTTIAVQNASPEVRDAIVAAIKRADSALSFPPPSAAVRHDGGKVFLEFVTFPSRAGPSVPLMRVEVPGIKVEEPPKMISMPRLNYPVYARREGLGDRVVVQFVVGTDGRIVPGSMDLLEAGYKDFSSEVLGAAKDARFAPAHIGACVLPALFLMPITFTIRE